MHASRSPIGWQRGERAFAIMFSVLALGAVLSPLARAPDDDSFPLSTYPMFSHPRPRTLVVTHALGIDARGRAQPLSPAISAATSEVLQSTATLSLAVQSGAADRECATIAARVAATTELEHVTHVELSTDAFDAVAYFAEGATTPASREVHARCDVPRERRR